MNNKYSHFYTFPYLIWMSLFFAIPTMLVILVSLLDQSSWDKLIVFARTFSETGFAGITELQLNFGLDAYKEFFEPRVTVTIWRTFSISLIVAIMCVIISVPTAHFISRSEYKQTWLMLLILPFWTNFLIRIFMWIKILGNNGIINRFLLDLNIIEKPLSLIYNNFAVTWLSIYVCLPFSIIPIFSTIEKFDFSLWEVSEDLGAQTWQTLLYVYLPGIQTGIFSAFVFAFINTFGNYAVAKLVGGQNSYMLGNLVVHNSTVGRNMPLAAAISTIICVISLLLLSISNQKIGQNDHA